MTTKSTTKHTSGRFCWHELSSPDVAKSRAFYGDLFGWTYTEMDMGPAGTYTLARSGDRDIGGFMKLDPSTGAPPNWLAYSTTPDVDKLAERAAKMGGAVVVPPMDIPDVGRFAIIRDAQGGVLGALKGTTETEDPAPAAGRFCWDELGAADPKKAYAFYSELFAWGVKEMDMGPGGTYRILTREGKDAAGIGPQKQGAPVMWLSYIQVDDVDASAKKAAGLGGKVLEGGFDIPNIGRMAIVADPHGAVFALYKSATPAAKS
jgi:predicted enzyme related to lactoylglutathione lyase